MIVEMQILVRAFAAQLDQNLEAAMAIDIPDVEHCLFSTSKVPLPQRASKELCQQYVSLPKGVSSLIRDLKTSTLPSHVYKGS